MISRSSSDWEPSANLESLRARAELLADIRSYFAQQGVLEVDTPLLSASTVTDPYLDAFQLEQHYLQTSPEYAMKRLLSAGYGDMYQICKAFRQEEEGRLHNVEFTLLEWYRVEYNLEKMFDEIRQLLQITLGTQDIDIHQYQDLFAELLDIDIHSCSLSKLQTLLERHCHGISLADYDDCLTTLFAVIIEPQIGQKTPCIVTGFPASQASLARLNESDPRLANRFEVYYRGVELANGFHELTDAAEQEQRFLQDNQRRLKVGKKAMPIDYRLLTAIETGLPDCVGIAMGIDRLLMLKLNIDSIDEVIAFPSAIA